MLNRALPRGVMPTRLSEAKRIEPSRPAPVWDCDLARSLSAQVGERHRLDFARSITEAVVDACWIANGIKASRPAAPGASRVPLSSEASELAARLGTRAAESDPTQAAYLIGCVYTSALPDGHRSSHGIFYTPPVLVEHLLQMAEQAAVNWQTCRVLDPACGGGAFLIGAAFRILASMKGTEPALILQQLGARLRGFDIDPFGCWLAQVMLEMGLKDLTSGTGRPLPMLVEMRDSLRLKEEEFGRYDLVIGNPPYGRISLSAEDRRHFRRSVYGHANLYGLFTDASLHWVKSTGVVGFVTPTSMVSGLYYKSLRELLAHEAPPLAVNFVVERDGVFADVLQETMLATYRKGGVALHGRVGFITVGSGGDARLRMAGAFALPKRASAPWLLPRVPEQARLVRRLRAMPHRLANYGYGVSTGPLVWNRHKSQFRTKSGPDTLPVIWAESVTSDGRFFWRSEKRSHAPWFAPKKPKDDWLIVTRQCVLLQRTTAKEQARRLIAAELPQDFIEKHGGVVIENHLNMVRAKTSEPAVPPAVIAALLNSQAADAAFRCINGSVAVSAFELEELPLPAPSAMTKITQLIARRAPRTSVEAAISAAYGMSDVATAA